MEKGNIYYLQNPITGEVFYVGATKKPLKTRLRAHYAHLRECKKGLRKSNRRFEYLENLLPTKATIHLLEIVDIDKIDEKEIYYISCFKKQYPNLVNMTTGGRGGFTSEFYTEKEFEEYSKKISEANKNKKKPEGFSEHLSEIRKGKNNPAAKEMKEWIVCDEKYLFKYGFEINDFLNNKNAYSNIFAHFYKRNGKGNPYKHKWNLFSELSKEIQDIVQSLYENKE